MTYLKIEDQLLPTPMANDAKNATAPPSQHERVTLHLPVVVSLLPTPTAWEQRETPEQWQERHDRNASKEEGATSAGMPLSIAAQLLPTPTTSDRNGPGEHGDGGRDLRTTVSLLPTPRAQNGDPRNMRPWIRPLDQPQNLENVIGRLLPTPMAGDCKVFGPNIDWEKRGEKQGLPGLVMTQLLPTPTTRDYKDVGENTNYEKIAKKHKLPGVIMTLPSDDGEPPLEDQPQPQPTPED
jgi:hypothetical protein